MPSLIQLLSSVLIATALMTGLSSAAEISLCEEKSGWEVLSSAVRMSGERVEVVPGQYFYVSRCGESVERSRCRLVPAKYNATCKTRHSVTTALVKTEDGEEEFAPVRVPIGCFCVEWVGETGESSEVLAKPGPFKTSSGEQRSLDSFLNAFWNGQAAAVPGMNERKRGFNTISAMESRLRRWVSQVEDRAVARLASKHTYGPQPEQLMAQADSEDSAYGPDKRFNWRPQDEFLQARLGGNY